MVKEGSREEETMPQDKGLTLGRLDEIWKSADYPVFEIEANR